MQVILNNSKAVEPAKQYIWKQLEPSKMAVATSNNNKLKAIKTVQDDGSNK